MRRVGKVCAPPQLVDNLWPLCVSPCCAAEEWDSLSSHRARGPHKLQSKPPCGLLENKKHVRFHLLISMREKTIDRVRKKRRRKTTRDGVAAVFFTSNSPASLHRSVDSPFFPESAQNF